ncbi:MAG: DUF4355 domain-containing protein [Sarcina sp.]
MKGRFIRGLIPMKMLSANDGGGSCGGDSQGADGNKGGSDNTAGDEREGDGDSDGSKGGDSNKGSNDDIEIKIQERLKAEKLKWEQEREKEKTEAEKLKNMSNEQKAKYEQEKRIKQLEDRERAITERELKATAYETLAEKGLPKELIDTLSFKDADTCNQSIMAVEKAFKKAVEVQVNEKLRGGKVPKSKGTDNSKSISLNDLKGKSAVEINAMWDKVQR